MSRPAETPASPFPEHLNVQEMAGAWLVKCRKISEPRGDLCVTEIGRDLPFLVKRAFWVFNVPEQGHRGGHAHRDCHQLLVCTHGTLTVQVDDGHQQAEVVLNHPDRCLYIPPMIWSSEQFTGDAVLMVLTSHNYNTEEYIRDYDEYLRLRR